MDTVTTCIKQIKAICPATCILKLQKLPKGMKNVHINASVEEGHAQQSVKYENIDIIYEGKNT